VRFQQIERRSMQQAGVADHDVADIRATADCRDVRRNQTPHAREIR
jgi:hypothetical protein